MQISFIETHFDISGIFAVVVVCCCYNNAIRLHAAPFWNVTIINCVFHLQTMIMLVEPLFGVAKHNRVPRPPCATDAFFAVVCLPRNNKKIKQ